MHPDEFYSARKEDWQALTRLLDVGESNIQRLSTRQVREIGRLYRAAAADLAIAQRDFPRHRISEFLNQLVGRAHAFIYQDEPLALARIWDFIRVGFPQAFRNAGAFIWTAALMFILPAIFTGILAYIGPDTARWILPAQLQQLIPLIERQELWIDMAVSERPFMSAVIMTNNIQVSFMAFAGGMLAGLLTTFVMLQNGLMLGGLTGLTAHHGVGFELWTFIIGHGVIELSVIFIAGGAGLMLGWAILRPGLLSRGAALRLAALNAVQLLIGCVPLLIIAGLIEGFLSPAESVPPIVKWVAGIGSGVVLYAYLLFSGREAEQQL